MVIEQSNMEAKRFTGYSQGRGARFSGLGVRNCSFFLFPLFPFPPPPSRRSSWSRLGGFGPPNPLASAAPGYSYEMQVCKSHIIT